MQTPFFWVLDHVMLTLKLWPHFWNSGRFESKSSTAESVNVGHKFLCLSNRLGLDRGTCSMAREIDNDESLPTPESFYLAWNRSILNLSYQNQLSASPNSQREFVECDRTMSDKVLDKVWLLEQRRNLKISSIFASYAIFFAAQAEIKSATQIRITFDRKLRPTWISLALPGQAMKR